MTQAGLDIVTFGCRLNLAESASMRALAAEAGLADTVVVNTCAVTSEAERQARQAIRRLRRERPAARIVATGCAVQIDAASWAAMPEVDAVMGNAEKLNPATYAAFATGRAIAVGPWEDASALPDDPAPDLPGHSRGFLQVQNGCDHRCTFCVIPFGRGPSRSLPAGAVVERARAMVAAGRNEIVLSGVDLTAWGADLPGNPGLGALCRRLLKLVPELPRLRLSSLDPVEIDDELVALLGEEPRLMPHLHLSVQAGADLTLKRMKRRHGRDDVLRLVDKARARRPDVVFGADLIAGFPTETDTMFADTLALVEQADLLWLHVFPYSPRAGTPAARMPQVPGPVRRERAARLRAAGEARVDRFLQAQRGRVVSALIELDGSGHTEHFAPVRPVEALPAGAVVDLAVVGVEGRWLIATSVERAAA